MVVLWIMMKAGWGVSIRSRKAAVQVPGCALIWAESASPHLVSAVSRARLSTGDTSPVLTQFRQRSGFPIEELFHFRRANAESFGSSAPDLPPFLSKFEAAFRLFVIASFYHPSWQPFWHSPQQPASTHPRGLRFWAWALRSHFRSYRCVSQVVSIRASALACRRELLAEFVVFAGGQGGSAFGDVGGSHARKADPVVVWADSNSLELEERGERQSLRLKANRACLKGIEEGVVHNL